MSSLVRTRKLMRINLYIIGLSIWLAGCVSQEIASTIGNYNAVATQVELGDAKDKVLSILSPTQDGLRKEFRKSPEKFINEGKQVDIYFFRSSWQRDGLTTDDEFTPYIFIDEKLVGIGWASLGGPKTQGQALSNTNNANRTNRVNQQILNHGAGGCTPNFATGGCL